MLTLPKLAYEYSALEPYIDEETMKIHHTKHHQTYVDKLNAWLSWTEFESYTDSDLIKLVSDMSNYDDRIKPIIRNHWGGHINHTLFRESMSPNITNIEDFSELTEKILSDFWSIENFKKEFSDKALALFWSWWTWLELDNNKLQITNYPNQENPYMYNKKPILWLDLREHAYYLLNQNRRPEYISKRRNVINRENIQKNLTS